MLLIPVTWCYRHIIDVRWLAYKFQPLHESKHRNRQFTRRCRTKKLTVKSFYKHEIIREQYWSAGGQDTAVIEMIWICNNQHTTTSNARHKCTHLCPSLDQQTTTTSHTGIYMSTCSDPQPKSLWKLWAWETPAQSGFHAEFFWGRNCPYDL